LYIHTEGAFNRMACDLVDLCRSLSTEGDHARKLRRNDIRSHIRGKDIAKLNSLVPALQKRDRGFDHTLKPHFSIEIARVAYPSRPSYLLIPFQEAEVDPYLPCPAPALLPDLLLLIEARNNL